jgi:hypothetical protein
VNCTVLQRQEPVVGKLELDEAIAVARAMLVLLVIILGTTRPCANKHRIYERNTVPRSLGVLATTTKKVSLAVVLRPDQAGPANSCRKCTLP